jgi:hypothetical protein
LTSRTYNIARHRYQCAAIATSLKGYLNRL